MTTVLLHVEQRRGWTYVVVEPDGRWPTVWPTQEIADLVAFRRARLAELPRGRRIYRGEPCWLGPQYRGGNYSRLKTPKKLASAMGLSCSGQGNKKVKGHRLSFFIFNGHLPTLGTVEHACARPLCVNPAHLDDMTPEENLLRAAERKARRHGRGRRNAR
jgi:hypothetical protein